LARFNQEIALVIVMSIFLSLYPNKPLEDAVNLILKKDAEVRTNVLTIIECRWKPMPRVRYFFLENFGQISRGAIKMLDVISATDDEMDCLLDPVFLKLFQKLDPTVDITKIAKIVAGMGINHQKLAQFITQGGVQYLPNKLNSTHLAELDGAIGVYETTIDGADADYRRIFS
jgi:hypothetical protein